MTITKILPKTFEVAVDGEVMAIVFYISAARRYVVSADSKVKPYGLFRSLDDAAKAVVAAA